VTFRTPLSTVDPVARQAAAAAQTAAGSAQTAANSAITLAKDPLSQIPDGAVPGSKLAADAVDGRTITGSTLRTAASGKRVQIDSTNGLVSYNAAGAAVTQVRTSDGALIATGAQITGTLQTGATAGPGVRLYQDSYSTTAATGRGIVEIGDGVTGNAKTTLIRTPGTNMSDFSGGSLVLTTGTFWGVAGPTLRMLVDKTPDAGSVAPHVQIDKPLYVQNRLMAPLGIGWTYPENNSTYGTNIGSGWADLSGHNFTITPDAGVLDVEWRVPKVTVSSGGEVQFRLLITGVVFDALDMFSSGPARMTATVQNDGFTDRTVQVQGRVISGTASVSAAGIGPVVLRYLVH